MWFVASIEKGAIQESGSIGHKEGKTPLDEDGGAVGGGVVGGRQGRRWQQSSIVAPNPPRKCSLM